LRKRDARNVQALRLAHVAAGKGVGADRLTPYGGRKLHPRGNPLGLPHQNLNLQVAQLHVFFYNLISLYTS
jgi:hypothetical protein